MERTGRRAKGTRSTESPIGIREQKATGIKVLDDPAQARILFKPLRIEIMKLLAEARTCTELAEALGATAQKIYYHVKVLEKGGLVERVSERKVRGIVEGVYRASASMFRLAPDLNDRVGGDPASRSALSIDYLTGLARDLLLDANRLAESGLELPTLSIDARVELRSEADRSDFRREVEEAIRGIAAKYGRKSGGSKTEAARSDTFKLLLVCYPEPDS